MNYKSGETLETWHRKDLGTHDIEAISEHRVTISQIIHSTEPNSPESRQNAVSYLVPK